MSMRFRSLVVLRWNSLLAEIADSDITQDGKDLRLWHSIKGAGFRVGTGVWTGKNLLRNFFAPPDLNILRGS